MFSIYKGSVLSQAMEIMEPMLAFLHSIILPPKIKSKIKISQGEKPYTFTARLVLQ